MRINPNNMTVATYCASLKRGDVVVNRTYQRSDKVWPDAARGYLIETIILGFPLPKMYLYPLTDLKSRRTISEIVDGQQRTMAIYSFYNDGFALPSSVETEDIAGKTYSALKDENKQKFINYSLSFDEFIGANRDEIVEVFRRINSYTIPLNAEEHRHAVFQGNFKWFINKLAARFNKAFVDLGVFSEKQLVRMADTKLLSEVCDATFDGIRTTNKRILDGVYKNRNKRFPEEKQLDEWLTEAIDQIRDWNEVHHTNLMKPYLFYSLLLAVVHERRVIQSLQALCKSEKLRTFDRDTAMRNLLQLDDALDNPDANPDFQDFIAACTEKTNTREQRGMRFEWICKALASPEFP